MSKMNKYSVVVVEDEPKIRRNIVQKIECSIHFEVVGTASNGLEAISLIKSLQPQPNVLFTDIKMPKLDGLALINQIKIDFPEMHIAILSGYSDFDYAKQAMKMGVRDYLLKPLKMEALSEALENIRTRLEINVNAMERTILTSDIIGNPSVTETVSLNDEEFMVFLICIGNLCTHITSLLQAVKFHDYWSNIPMNNILKNILNDHEKWWVIDEKTPNQKFLVISAKNSQSSDISQIAINIKNALLLYMSMLSVNICHNAYIIKRKDIWEKAQALRIILDRELVMGKSNVITSINQLNPKTTPILVDLKLRNKMTAFIQSGEKTLLKQEIFDVFHKWEALSYPQRLLEKATNQLIRTIYLQTETLTEDELYHLEYGLYEKLAVIPNFTSIFEEAWKIIDSMLTFKNEEDPNTKKIVDQIADYIKLNFTEFINLEVIARKYHLNPTYLSKIFKKYYGETPLKFLITLRIDEAKRLIRENPNHEIGKIGEIVGYSDQHYFSRIFKNSTGKSPSEFRELTIE